MVQVEKNKATAVAFLMKTYMINNCPKDCTVAESGFSEASVLQKQIVRRNRIQTLISFHIEILGKLKKKKTSKILV